MTTMKIERRDPLTGKTNVMDLPVTPEQLAAWRNGTLIQRAMPDLTADQREFLMTGLMPDSWDALFPEEDQP
jgi:hypothetical protein